jgi:hypothetical protein
MARRFEETVNIQPQSFATGAPQALQSLSARLEQFASTRQRQADVAAVQRGQQAAQQVQLEKEGGITQAPKLKDEPLFFGTIEAKAHNKALQAAYISSIGTDIKTQVGLFEGRNPDNLVAFNAAIDGLRAGLDKSVDPSVKQQALGFLDERSSSARIRVQNAGIKKQNDAARDEIFTSIESFADSAATEARNGDNLLAAKDLENAFAAIDAAVDSGFLSIGQAREQRREIEREATEQTLRREFDIKSDESLPEAFELIDKKRKKVPRGWTPDEWDRYLTSQNVELNRKASRLNKEVVKMTQDLEDSENLERGLQFTDPDIPADPSKSGQDRKDVNTAFEHLSQQWANLSGEEQLQNVQSFVLDTGIIPDALISRSAASMRSGNTDSVVVWSRVINDLADSPNPSILRDLPQQTRAVALQVKTSTDAGIDTQIAIDIARKNTYGLTDADRKKIKLETQAIRPDLPNILEDVLDKHFDPGFFTLQPDVNPGIQADFNVAFEQFMVMTDGNSEQSSKLASGAIRENWGANRIDGDTRMQKFAPSVFYSVPGVDDDWMEDQFESDLKTLGDVSNFRIAVNPETIKTSQPTYFIMTTDEEGLISPIFDEEGGTVEWAPDFTQTREYKELRALPQKEKRQARETRSEINRLKQILGITKEKFI